MCRMGEKVQDMEVQNYNLEDNLLFPVIQLKRLSIQDIKAQVQDVELQMMGVQDMEVQDVEVQDVEVQDMEVQDMEVQDDHLEDPYLFPVVRLKRLSKKELDDALLPADSLENTNGDGLSEKELDEALLLADSLENTNSDGLSDSEETPDLEPGVFKRGSLVWGKLRSYRWWPAICISNTDCLQKMAEKDNWWLLCLGNHKICEVPVKQMRDFVNCFKPRRKTKIRGELQVAVVEALNIVATIIDVEFDDAEQMLAWAENGFKSDGPSLPKDLPKEKKGNLALSNQTLNFLLQNTLCPVLPEEKVPKRPKTITKVPAKRIKIHNSSGQITEQCISCRGGRTTTRTNPMFLGGLCRLCKKRVTTILKKAPAIKRDACIICGKKGVLVFCTSLLCIRAYCQRCIDDMTPPDTFEKIKATDNWICYICKDDNDPECQIRCRRTKFVNNHTDFFPEKAIVKRPISVLAENEND